MPVVAQAELRALSGNRVL